MSAILDKRPEWYSQVRIKLIGSDNSNIIADSSLDLWSGFAERLIKLKATTWATIIAGTGDNKEFLIDATISMLCALFVTPLRNIISSDITVGEIRERKDIDFDKMEEDFYNEVEFWLSKITTYTATTVKRCGVIVNPATFEDIDS